MSRLNLDILYDIVEQIARFDSKNSRTVLLSLALVCRSVNDSIRPLLFSKVHWPHPNKHDAPTGLLFFPEALWPYFRSFHLDWPDHWPDASPPRWGEKPGLSVYYPKHLDKLEDALPHMTNIHTFQITCPFDPPTRLLRSLVACANITDLKITDTPMYTSIMPALPETFNISRLTLVAVMEAARIGEGPYDKRYQNIVYFMRGYRKKYSDTLGTSMYAAQRFFSALCKPECLQYLQISAEFLCVNELHDKRTQWPCLRTLVLTGPPPQEFDLATLIGQTPKLDDLRVLLSTSKAADPLGLFAQFAMIPPVETRLVQPGPPTAYAQLRALALSNAYNTKDVLRYTCALERLALCAIISPPRVPIALGRPDIEDLLADLEAGGGNETLRQIRLTSEEDPDPPFLAHLGRICPLLEIVEVERCGYQDAQDAADWDLYADALASYAHLRELRVAVPFQGCEELGHEHAQINNNNPACVRAFRKLCAVHLASRIPTLRRVGFEYRAKTLHRYEDRWLDFDIVQLRNGEVSVVELGPSWYHFPDIWEPVALQE